MEVVHIEPKEFIKFGKMALSKSQMVKEYIEANNSTEKKREEGDKMQNLINKLVIGYNDGEYTWHDIQDIVGGALVKEAGGGSEYLKIPAHERIHRENEILEQIEKRLKGGE